MEELGKYREELSALIEEKSPGGLPLLLYVRGSQMYGTDTPDSDVDFAGVFIQSIDDILGNNYQEQINDDTNDTVIYELRRFLELLSVNNPNMMESLSIPDNCLIYKHPVIDIILNDKERFITKMCSSSFRGYAKGQIVKAKGQDKKQNWENDKITRKTPLDFCHILLREKSRPLSEYLETHKLDLSRVAASNVPHSRGVYSLFYDFEGNNLAFRGIIGEDSNQLRLHSIPKNLPEENFIGHISYNQDGYVSHCKDYKSYMTWVKKRNDTRWIEVRDHGQKIDGKNMMHCQRLLNMAREIALGDGIITRRPDFEYLLSIRRGEVDLQTLIDNAEATSKEISLLYPESNLPDSVDTSFISKLLIDIRKKFYN